MFGFKAFLYSPIKSKSYLFSPHFMTYFCILLFRGVKIGHMESPCIFSPSLYLSHDTSGRPSNNVMGVDGSS